MFDDDDVVLEVEDLRPLIPVSRKTITNRLRDGRDLPPHFTVGRKTFFRRSAVLAWIEQREREAQDRLSQTGVVADA